MNTATATFVGADIDADAAKKAAAAADDATAAAAEYVRAALDSVTDENAREFLTALFK